MVGEMLGYETTLMKHGKFAMEADLVSLLTNCHLSLLDNRNHDENGETRASRTRLHNPQCSNPGFAALVSSESIDMH
jgi:hypothetical protein